MTFPKISHLTQNPSALTELREHSFSWTLMNSFPLDPAPCNWAASVLGTQSQRKFWARPCICWEGRGTISNFSLLAQSAKMTGLCGLVTAFCLSRRQHSASSLLMFCDGPLLVLCIHHTGFLEGRHQQGRCCGLTLTNIIACIIRAITKYCS